MEIEWYYKLLALLISFLLSAFFSGSEVALFSLDRKKMQRSFSGSSLISRYLLRLLEYPRRLLVTILIGNTCINVFASIVAVSIALDIYSSYHVNKNLILTLQIIVLSILIIFFGELIPKVWAARNPFSFAKAVAIPLYWINSLLFPISEILTEIVRLTISRVKIDKSKSVISPDEITELVDIGHERGTLVHEEHGLIRSIVNFREVTAYEVMTPRVDIVSIQDDTGFNEMMKKINNSGYSRLPLYKRSLDEIMGIIYAKDLLPYLRSDDLRKKLKLSAIARKAIFVPSTKLISELFREFQEMKMHIAIVVDEYGGTAGLITLEDILEEIIGEIRDEYDKEENPVNKIDENTYLVLGKLPMDDLYELINLEILDENKNFETVGGLVLSKAGSVPKEGYSFRIGNFKFTVKEVLKKRVMKVLIEKIKGE